MKGDVYPEPVMRLIRTSEGLRLVEATGVAKYVKDSVEGSLLRWEDFIDEPIRDPGPTAIEIPFEDRYASPEFARKRDNLCFDHNLLTTLNEGRAYTV